MQVEIVPEPPEDEAAAVVAALQEQSEGMPAIRSGWWRAGVRENVNDADGPPPGA